MKYIYTFLLVIAISFSFLRAQIPNAGFENWTGSEPDGWATNNADPYFFVTQSNSSHSGSSALKGESLNYFQSFVLGPTVFCEGDNGDGFPIDARYNSLKGFYKFNPQGGDQLYITVFLTQDTVGIGAGAIVLDGAASYTEFGVPIALINQGTPNLCYIIIEMINPIGGIIVTLGSEMYIDDLQLSMDMVSDVEDEFQPLVFKLDQNYPNPFNPSTTISYQLPTSGQVTLKVYNILGDEVASLINEEKPAGSYEVKFDASQLSSGIYFYKLQTGSFIETKKMMLLK